MVLEHVMAPAKPGEVAGLGRSTKGSIVSMVQIEFAGFDPAAWETTSRVTGNQQSLEVLAGPVPVNGKHRAGKRIRQYPVPGSALPRQGTGSGRVDRVAPVHLGGNPPGTKSSQASSTINQRSHRNGHIHSPLDGRQQPIRRVMAQRCPTEQQVREQIRAELIHGPRRRSRTGRISRSMRPSHLRQPVVDAVSHGGRQHSSQLGHPVGQWSHPDVALHSGPRMPVSQQRRLGLLGFPDSQSTHPAGRLLLGTRNHHGLVPCQDLGPVQRGPGILDHPHVCLADPALGKGLERHREPVQQFNRLAHLALNSAVIRSSCSGDLGSHSALRELRRARIPPRRCEPGPRAAVVH